MTTTLTFPLVLRGPDAAAPVRGEGARMLEAVAGGDRAALARLYDETSGLVHGLALRILGNASDAEEVVIEVFMQVWRSAGDFDPARGSVTAWLTTLTRSRAIDHLRSRSRFQGDPLEALPEPRAPGLNPEEEALAADRRLRIRAALAALSPPQREAIELAYFRGMSQSEVAAHLGQPLGTIKTRMRSGMLRLRDLLAGLESFSPALPGIQRA